MDIPKAERNLFDLISEKNAILSQHAEENWQDCGNIDISPAEWNFLALVYINKQTISNIARTAGISRQAAHKFFKNLETKNLVSIDVGCHRERLLILTSLGSECYVKYTSLQQQLEDSIASAVGKENIALLKGILTKEWLSHEEKEAQ